tara:strand:- start:2077 stop:3780 length:1704 start_codon:yes stop_codon:yes gene_type:complete
MADSIFNRPLFAGAGQSEKADKDIDRYLQLPETEQTTPLGPVSFNLSDVYKSDMVPFDQDGIASLMQAYSITPESVRSQYEEYAGKPKTALDFAAEYDSLTPPTTTPESNFKFESSLALARLGLGLMQPTPGGAIAPAISKAGEAFLGDLAAINERKRQDKIKRGELEAEEDRSKREYILKALQEQNDFRSASELDMFMKVLQMNQDADQGDIKFKRELAKQNFAYKYDVDMMAMENHAKLLREQYKQTPEVFALKPEGLDQTIKYVTGYYGIDPADGIRKPFVPRQIGDKIEYVPAPLDAVKATFQFGDDNTLKQNVKDQIIASEKINQGRQALSFVSDLKVSIAEDPSRIGVPGFFKRAFQNVRSTVLDVADGLLGAGVIDQDAYEAAKNKIDQSVFNDLANSYQANNPGRNATDFFQDKDSEEGLIYNELFIKPRENYDADIAANEIKLNSIYYAIARARKRTGRLNVDDIKAARSSLKLYTLDFTSASSDQIISALNTVELELRGFVDAQTDTYKKAGYNEDFLFNYETNGFGISVKLPATTEGAGNPVDTLDPYADLPEDIN